MPEDIANSELPAALKSTSDGIHPSKEVEGQLFDGGPVDGHRTGPIDPSPDDRPNLSHGGRSGRKKLPALNGLTHGGGTYDVNDEVIAQEYRRGLRVLNHRCSARETLGIVLDDI